MNTLPEEVKEEEDFVAAWLVQVNSRISMQIK